MSIDESIPPEAAHSTNQKPGNTTSQSSTSISADIKIFHKIFIRGFVFGDS